MPFELLFPATMTLGVVWTWVRGRRLYRHHFGRALQASIAAARRSGASSFFRDAAIMAILAAVFSSVVMAALPARGALFLLWSIASVAAMTFTWVIHPPGLLLLASSAGANPRSLVRLLAPAIQGYHAMYFLRADGRRTNRGSLSEDLDQYYRGTTANRYALSDTQWEAVVFPLIAIVPVVVIDARTLSESLEKEIGRIGADASLSAKSVMFAARGQLASLSATAPFVTQAHSESELQHSVAIKLRQWQRALEASSTTQLLINDARPPAPERDRGAEEDGPQRVAPSLADLVAADGGTFRMGTDDGEADAHPVHEVTVGTFKIGKYPVTVSEFAMFVEDTGYQTVAELTGGSHVWNGDRWKKDPRANWRNPLFNQSSRHPVVCVCWYDAVSFCNWLSAHRNLSPCYVIDPSQKDADNHYPEQDVRWLVSCDFAATGFRLPTEAEWEFAARGGRSTRCFRYAGSNTATEVAWFIDSPPDPVSGLLFGSLPAEHPARRQHDWTPPTRPGRINVVEATAFSNNGTTAAVGRKQPNELGIYDFSGNVREWCWDWYAEDYYSQSAAHDPRGPISGAFRVTRGGAWQTNNLIHLETTHRNYASPSALFTTTGFRLAATA